MPKRKPSLYNTDTAYMGMSNESNANVTNGSGSDIELQKRKFNIMKLKEEWEMAEKMENLANTTFRIVTSSIAGTGGILSLLNVIYERLKSNGDTIKELIKATKDSNSDKKFVPLLIEIPETLLTNDDLNNECKKYLKFLERINELIKEDKKINTICIVLASFYIIITSVISILINAGTIKGYSKYDDLLLAISIIVIGWKWFAITILSKFERTFEKWMNYYLEPQKESYIAFFNFCLKTAFVAPITQAIFAVFLKPSRIYYCLSKRLYLVNRYDPDYSNRNIPVDLEKVDIERVSFFEDQKIKSDQIDQKLRFFGTKEERKNVYSKSLTEFKIVSNKSRSNSPLVIIIIIISYLYTLIFQIFFILALFLISIVVKALEGDIEQSEVSEKNGDKPLEVSESNNESSEVSENKPENKVSEAPKNKLKIKDNLGLIEKYITPALISINVDTKYQLMVESIEITKIQKEQIRSILCGISETA
ncbi:hypothetical protein C2G38_2166753 [Gigaspora rosea]|uniref:Uncharacterized protein n=1 Tax=Gigaspora rosea TaxID=44941 RepID=A0A397VRE5_9GLOM|nr:hypothetical protein C2G38_2166753 [Gigaspora rosea]